MLRCHFFPSCGGSAARNLSARLLLACTIALLCRLSVAAVESSNIFSAHFNTIHQKNPSVFAAAVVTWEDAARGVDSSRTAGLGYQTIVDATTPMTVGTSFRTNTLSEMFLAMTVAYLEINHALPFSRHQPIPSAFLPPPYNETKLVNPLYPSYLITLTDLLLHISSFTEEGFADGEAASPAPVKSLEQFVENVFSKNAPEALWGNWRPGLGSSYRYSRLNSALVTYILEKVLAQQTTPVSVATFIQTTFIAPMGLSGTFLDAGGVAPAPTHPPKNGVDLSWRAVQDVARDGSEALRSPTVHAAYASDYMYYTSTLDLARLAFELFLGGRFTDIGDFLKRVPVEFGGNNLTQLGGVERALGVYNFDTTQLCEGITACGGRCHLGKEQHVFGWAVKGKHNQVALLCTREECVAAEVSYYAEFPASCAYALEFAALSLTQARYSIFLTATRWYFLYVFFGVLGTIILVLLGSCFTDYLVQPATVAKAAPVNRPNNAVSSINAARDFSDASPPLQSQAGHNPQGISPPVRRLDMYV